MSIVKRFVAVLVFAVAAVFVVLFCIILNVVNETSGPKIAKYENPQKALMVIDVQEDYTGTTARSPFPYKDSKAVIARINDAIGVAMDRHYRVVYVRQEFATGYEKLVSKMIAGDTAIKGRPGTEIDKRVAVVSKNVFTKSIGDAFSNPALEKFMVENSVDEIYLTGLDAERCVHSTAKGALNRGYKVHILTDAILLNSMEKWDGLMKEYRKEGIVLNKVGDM